MSLIVPGSKLHLSCPFECPKNEHFERELGAIKIGKHGSFHYSSILPGFRLSEIKIDRQRDFIIINAKNERNGPYEHYERSVKRIIKLPNWIDKENVSCKLNERGEFQIYAVRKTMYEIYCF